MANNKTKADDFLIFGEANPIEDHAIAPYTDPRRSSWMTVMKKAAQKTLEPDAISSTGPYKGYVLRVDSLASAGASSIGWLGRVLGKTGETSETHALVKVRIPEIHASLPIPQRLGDDPEPDNFIIDMYPTFKAERSDIPLPSINSFVWVDYGNKQNLTDPVYIGPVHDRGVPVVRRDASTAATDAFNRAGRPQAGRIGNIIEFVDQPSNIKIFGAPQYTEHRVRVGAFGILKPDSPLAVAVQDSRPKRRLHKLAAIRFNEMNKAWQRETGETPLVIVSGLRKHRWRNDYRFYTQEMIKEYGSLSRGKKFKAYKSPHETGLAFDLGNHGLAPKSSTIPQQERTKAYQWLTANAHRFGIFPYKKEPWHWEVHLTREAWATGADFVKNDDYGVIVFEESLTYAGKNTTNRMFVGTAFA